MSTRNLAVLATFIVAGFIGACSKGGEPTFKLSSGKAAVGGPVVATFSDKVPSPEGDRAWITICQKGAPDTEWGTWIYVPDQAANVTLTAPAAAGEYEVRLHTHYPTKSVNVVHRRPLQLE